MFQGLVALCKGVRWRLTRALLHGCVLEQRIALPAVSIALDEMSELLQWAPYLELGVVLPVARAALEWKT